jgi:CBS domain containing-hemolysin-like protein
MSSDLAYPLLGFLVSAILAGLVTASQAALHHINRVRFRHLVESGAPRGRAVLQVLEEPNSLFSGTALVGTLALVGATLCGVVLVAELWPLSPALAVAVAVLLFALLLLVQVTMRALALHYPEGWALRLLGPLLTLSRLLCPVTIPLLAVERAVLRALGVRHVSEAPAAAEDELRMLVEEEGNGVLEEDEREMIQGIFELGDRLVREVMVPRLDVTGLPVASSVGDATDLAVDSGYSRLPVYEDSLDNVVGILVVKDLLAELKSGRLEAPIKPLVRPAYFVPETKKIDELLREMQEKHVLVAIVIDEYGGTAGLITIEDLVEEIVGEIQDEYDTEEALFERVSDDEVIFEARASIDDVNDVMDLHLQDEQFDTLGGLVYDRLGKVPVVGDEVRVNGCLVTVLATHGRRVMKVRVRRIPPEAGESHDSAA